MTETEAKNFVSEVLKGLWPRWTPKDYEIKGWLERLSPFDFGRAQKAVNNVFFAQESRGIDPPAGRILQALRTSAVVYTEKKKNNPVLLFEIIKDGRETGEKFFANVPANVPPQQEIENMAERTCKKFNEIYGDKHYFVLAGMEQKKEVAIEQEDNIPF
jgi:hypothetical protein